MKNIYLKTNWIDNKTPVNSANLNNIEKGIATLFANAISFSELVPGDGISITTNDDTGDITFSTTDSVVKSNSIKGIEYVVGELASYPEGYIYFVLAPDTQRLIKIVIDNIVVYAVEQ